mgnify:FL=1
MHELNVLVYGPVSFQYTLNELKPFLKFNHLHESSKANFDIILFHDEALNDKRIKDIIADSKLLKICASNSKYHKGNFDTYIQLPTTVKDINLAVENTSAKKKFSINSSIEVKNYLLNKNEKRLLKNNNFIILTEKEIHLIELLLKNTNPITKEVILSSVWNYSSDADTHTVETHIYRLRKKIKEKFKDNKFILNNKNGYYL